MRTAIYQISIDGADVSNAFDPVLISLTIKMGDGGEADCLDLELDDTDGQIELPRVGASVTAALGWQDDSLPEDEQGVVVMFEGFTDEPKSSGGRKTDKGGAHHHHHAHKSHPHAKSHGSPHGGAGAADQGSTPTVHVSGSRSKGRTMTISAKSADMSGKIKQPQSRHVDTMSFGEVAVQWGQKAGLDDVKVDASLASIQRPYWSMANESFMHRGTRVARDLGATFKIFGTIGVFVPRAGGTSASGQSLQAIDAVWGENLIEWSITPILSRPDYSKLSARYYDPQQAKWMREDSENDGSSSGVTYTERWKSPHQDHASSRAGANAAESKRDKGCGDTVTIDGEPAAQAEADCNVDGVREGVDGTYTIKSVSHTLSRHSGFITHLMLAPSRNVPSGPS